MILHMLLKAVIICCIFYRRGAVMYIMTVCNPITICKPLIHQDTRA